MILRLAYRSHQFSKYSVGILHLPIPRQDKLIVATNIN